MSALPQTTPCCSPSKIPGYIILGIYIVSSLALAECAQITLSHINRPYFIRYINSSMAIMLFLFPIYAKIKQRITSNNESPTPIEMHLYDNAQNIAETEIVNKTSHDSDQSIIEGNRIHYLLYTIIGTILHTGGGFLYYLSLTGTTVPTALTLGKLKAVMVYILSVIFLKHLLSIWKCIAIMVSFIGIFCYVYEASESDSESTDTWWGCLSSVSAAISWSIYDIWTNITYKKYFPNSKYYGTVLYEGLIGFWTIFIFWFVIFIQQPIFDDEGQKSTQVTWIIITGFVLTATNAAFFVALNLTSPVFMNYASFLVIPCSFIMDVFIHNYEITVLPIFGAIFIVSGFIMLEIISEPKWFTKCKDGLKRKIKGDQGMIEQSDNMQFIESIQGDVDLEEIENMVVQTNETVS